MKLVTTGKKLEPAKIQTPSRTTTRIIALDHESAPISRIHLIHFIHIPQIIWDQLRAEKPASTAARANTGKAIMSNQAMKKIIAASSAREVARIESKEDPLPDPDPRYKSARIRISIIYQATETSPVPLAPFQKTPLPSQTNIYSGARR